ncbi:MAG: ferrous iron transport protein B [Polyangia bacterium]|nr:ferrous iron transport protein B [Polyangia bacterium]
MSDSHDKDRRDLSRQLEGLLEFLDARDPVRRSHAQGVAVISELVGRSMGLGEERQERLRLAALLHDLGMAAVPMEVVGKPERLTEQEFAEVKRHPALGRDMLVGHPLLAEVAEIVGSHHEHFDGQGYPKGLAGEAIPLEARIIAVADAFQAMTSDRPYRPRLDAESAYEEISRLAGGQFCPEAVRHFNEVRHEGRRILEGGEASVGVLAEEDDIGKADSAAAAQAAMPDKPYIDAASGADSGSAALGAKRLVRDEPAEERDYAKPLPAGPASRPSAAPKGHDPHVPLDTASPGQTARVEHVGGDPQFRRRLLELGLVPGALVRIVRVAPLGDPVEVELRGASFTLRKSEAALVEVRPSAGEGEAFLKVPRPSLGRAPASRRFRVAVAGNPNSGKTTLFNALTGSRGRVGNYPGITVERLIAQMTLPSGLPVELIDVPGTYSLTARSREEQVAIDEILGRAGAAAPDLVLVVLNALTLDRSLYLMMQIQELGFPVVAAVNMMDEAWSGRLHIDLEGLSASLGVPVLGVVARTGQGLGQLRKLLDQALGEDAPAQLDRWRWQPNEDLLRHLDELVPAIGELLGPDASLNRRRAYALWCLMSLSAEDDLEGIPGSLRERVGALRASILEEGHDLDLEVTRSRFGAIDALLAKHTSRGEDAARASLSERLDGVFTHPLWGSLSLLVVMGLVFMTLFEWLGPAMDGIKWLFDRMAAGTRSLAGDGLLGSLVADGVVTGVGSVLVFLPQIIALFLFIALLESSGYLSRAAFLMDRLMRKVGLNGKAFVPMLSGYACAIPAVLATRTLENKRDRLLTMLVIPLMSCSARLPVYTLIITALFPAKAKVLGFLPLGAVVLLGLYVISTAMAMAAAAVLGRTVLKGKPQPLLLELPPYRLPSLGSVANLVKERSWSFLRTAGTVILVASLVLWVMLTFPRPERYKLDYPKETAAVALAQKEAREARAKAKVAQDLDGEESARKAELGHKERIEELGRMKRAEELEHSFAGRFGKLLEPVIRPLGFDWKIGVGLIGAFAAREVFVSTMAQVYAADDGDGPSASLYDKMHRQRHADGTPVWTLLTGITLMIFFMLAMQCVSTLAVVRQESGGWKWVGVQVGYMTGLAYVVSLIVYQVGRVII